MAEVDESQVVFIDTETTGLNPERHEIWELAFIADGREYEYQFPVRLSLADSAALRINHFYERRRSSNDLDVVDVGVYDLVRLTAGRMIVGAVPSFDVGFLEPLIRSCGYCPAWSHRLICVETLAAGALKVMPCGLSKMAEKLGISIDQTVAHTALGDARLAREVYRAVFSSD